MKNIKSLLIAAGMSVCMLGLLSSSTECMESNLNAQNFDVRQFEKKVNAKSVTAEDEKVVMQEMDKRVKDGSLDENLKDAFRNFIEYKIKESSLNKEIEERIWTNTKRICEKATKLTDAEKRIVGYKVGNTSYKGIFHIFMEFKIEEDYWTQESEEMFQACLTLFRTIICVITCIMI